MPQWTLPVEFEEALWNTARATFPRAMLTEAALCQAIEARSRLYTSERDDLASAPDEDVDLAARALFFTVCDAPKIRVPLAELAGRGLLPEAPPRVLDLGAGVGAMSLGLLAELPGKASITWVDQDQEAMEIGVRTLEKLGAAGLIDVSLLTVDESLAEFEPPPGTFDLILVGNVLNELSAEERIALPERWLAGLAPNGALIVIDPALRETSRQLHEVRDRLLASGAAHVFAPCTRQVAPCPALADERDWCHEDRPVALPRRAAGLARATHLRDSSLKFSYLVLRREPSPLVEPGAGGGQPWRVVSQPQKGKGRRECFACSDAGRVRMRLLKRNRSDANRAFERAARGDVLVIGGGAEAEIGQDRAIALLRPAQRAP